MTDMQVCTTPQVSYEATFYKVYRFSQKGLYLQVDGTPHYLKMLAVIAAFGILHFLIIISQIPWGNGARSKGAETGGKGGKEDCGRGVARLRGCSASW